jgi:hypothetical protein
LHYLEDRNRNFFRNVDAELFDMPSYSPRRVWKFPDRTFLGMSSLPFNVKIAD